MTSKILRIAATIVLVCAPSFAYAQPHGGGGGGGHPGGGGGGGGRPQGGGARPAPAQAPMRPAPVEAPIRQAAPAGNFNFNHDIAPEQRAAPIARPAMPVRPVTVARPMPIARPATVARPVTAARPAAAVSGGRPATSQIARPATVAGHGRGGGTNGERKNGPYRRAPVTAAATGGQYRGHFNGQPIANRRSRGGHWGWNHGSRWNGANGYWGGGFWGDFALASIGGFALYGSIEDSQNGYEYDSYRVDADTPGAELLNDYQLEQAECGPSGLVDIWGPDGSVICAFPNDNVPPGDYQVNPESFTLVPAT